MKKGDMWTETEDARILEGVRHFGQKWQLISANVPGRSANAVRNRYLRCIEGTAPNTSFRTTPPMEGDHSPLDLERETSNGTSCASTLLALGNLRSPHGQES
jgi:hypothetical protein